MIDKRWIVVAILGCQVDCIRNEQQSRNGGTSLIDPDIVAGRQNALNPDLEVE